MRRLNVIGRIVARQRFELAWTQEILTSRMQCLGADITRQRLANMECGRTQIPDELLPFFQKVFAMRIVLFFSKEVQELDEQFARRDQLLKIPNQQSRR
jgi:hypothetical protein